MKKEIALARPRSERYVVHRHITPIAPPSHRHDLNLRNKLNSLLRCVYVNLVIGTMYKECMLKGFGIWSESFFKVVLLI